MKVKIIGEGEPEYGVVTCLHGDEPEGWEAVKKVIQKDFKFNKSVKFILANEKAKREGVRYTGKDLNRVFPGKENGVHEEKLASRILNELEGLKVLDLHTTHSKESPFQIVSNPGEVEKNLVKATGITNVIDMSIIDGTLDNEVDAVVVEASKSDNTVQELIDILENFLASENIIDKEFEETENDYYEVYEKDKGSGFDFIAENFELVEKNEVYAKSKNDTKVADEDFYPVLMSSSGYEDQLGFKAKKKEI